MKRKKKERIVLEARKAGLIDPPPPPRYMTLTIEFVESEDGLPRFIDVPYLPWHPKERLSLPYRLAKPSTWPAPDGPPGEIAEEWGK